MSGNWRCRFGWVGEEVGSRAWVKNFVILLMNDKAEDPVTDGNFDPEERDEDQKCQAHDELNGMGALYVDIKPYAKGVINIQMTGAKIGCGITG